MRDIDGLLKQRSLFEKYLNPSVHQLSTFHFSSLFLWQDFFDFELEVVKDSLCVFAHQKGTCFLYLPPLSQIVQLPVVDHCFSKMNKVNPRTARIENVEKANLDLFNDQFKAYPKASEYVYQKQELIELKGNAYKSQRHDIHHFQSHYQAIFRRYEESDLKECLGLYESWAKVRHDKHEDEVYRQMLEENRIVHELALLYHKALGLAGYVVEINKKIAAYSFGYSLNLSVFCVLLEISDTSSTGLSAFIFNRVCADELLREHMRINTMDDFGLPYVAASKQAYHPIEKPVSYTLTRI